MIRRKPVLCEVPPIEGGTRRTSREQAVVRRSAGLAHLFLNLYGSWSHISHCDSQFLGEVRLALLPRVRGISEY